MSVRSPRFTLAAVLLPLIAVGCATQTGEPQAGKPQVAAPAAQPVVTATAAAAATPDPAATPMPSLPPPSALELQVGLQVAHISVTGSGGLVDARFKVLDAAKVKALLGDPANTPTLIAGDKPPLIASHHALKGARFAEGQVFFVLYPNTRSAVQPGVEVMVGIGQTRLGPVKAQ